jgi:anaerobic selenocysteine-containing dehydrogenase
MSEREPQVSRRHFLQAAALGGAAAIASTMVGSPAAAANKVPQKAVSYQPNPKGNQRCDNCAFWQNPAACKLVDGNIAAAGWCTLYKKQ